MYRLVVLALLIPALSGCLGDQGEAPVEELTVEETSATPEPREVVDPFVIDIGIGTPELGTRLNQISGGDDMYFEILPEEGVATVEFGFDWDCASPTCDLRFNLVGEAGLITHFEGSAPLQAGPTALGEGAYELRVFSSRSNSVMFAEGAGTITITAGEAAA